MANTISSIKRGRIEARRTEFNQQNKTRLRHQIRIMRKALAAKDPKSALEALASTFSVIDRAARAGIIKSNTAGRYKSRMHARVKAMQPAA
jgi:small subunit ribosomal protein S20